MKVKKYNKKKKPWRKLKWTEHYKKNRKRKILIGLSFFVILEGIVLLPGYRGKLLSISHKAEAKEKSIDQSELAKKPGETREQGISIDWKEGTVKLWQKVIRVEKKKD